MKTHEKPKETEKIPCPICDKVFKAKHMFEKHVEKHTEKTAEQYQENKRLEAEEKKQRKKKKEERKSIDGAKRTTGTTKRTTNTKGTENAKGVGTTKRKLPSSDVSDADEEDDEDESDSDKLSGKRKQRKPNKVLKILDEDKNTKMVVRKKFSKTAKHKCTKCDDVFRSQLLLKSHMKLHDRELVEQNTQQENDIDQSGIPQSEEINSNITSLSTSASSGTETTDQTIGNAGQNGITDSPGTTSIATGINDTAETSTGNSDHQNDLTFLAESCQNLTKETLQLPSIVTATTEQSTTATQDTTLSSNESNAMNKAAMILQGDHAYTVG